MLHTQTQDFSETWLILFPLSLTLERTRRNVLNRDPVRTAQYTHSVSVIQTSQLMQYREIIAVCSEIHTKQINTAVWAESGIFEC